AASGDYKDADEYLKELNAGLKGDNSKQQVRSQVAEILRRLQYANWSLASGLMTPFQAILLPIRLPLFYQALDVSQRVLDMENLEVTLVALRGWLALE